MSARSSAPSPNMTKQNFREPEPNMSRIPLTHRLIPKRNEAVVTLKWVKWNRNGERDVPKHRRRMRSVRSVFISRFGEMQNLLCQRQHDGLFQRQALPFVPCGVKSRQAGARLVAFVFKFLL